MRRSRLPIAVLAGAACAVMLVLAGQSASGAERPGTTRPPATIQAVMDRLIDPAADALWASVGTIEQAGGTVTRTPHSAHEWLALRRSALDLAAGAKRLQSPLPVGANGHGTLADASTPGTRTARQIRADIDRDPRRFYAAAARLQRGAEQALGAVDARDDNRLLRAGARIDAACEACHHAYWYPRTPPLPLPAPDAFGRRAGHP